MFDRISQKNYNGTRKYGWSYNAKGYVGRHADNENGKTYTYEYDLLGRIQRVHISDGSFIESSYNNIDLSTGMTYGFGGTSKTVGYSYSDKDNMPETVTLPDNTAITNSYDKIGRVTSVNYGDAFSYNYTYKDVDSEKTTGLVSSMTSLADLPMYLYQYDNNGNIVAFCYANYDGTDSSAKETYEYDSLNQLVRTNSLLQNATWVYDYDDGGNILSKTKYEYTTASDLSGLTPVETINYTYGNENWGDLLTSYNGKAITYDTIGNPLTYDGWTYTWKDGRRLATASDSTTSLSYKYNADGIRTQKTVNGTTTEFFLNGTQIIAQKTGGDIMWFYYDHDGTRIALEYQGAMYYYAYNLQGDVKYISDANGNVCGGYHYDDWGKVSVFNSGPNTVATANPFRYRGYYYDTETELYYLNSRYYNPEWGRFISADSVVAGSGASVKGYNLFTYCFNNPINMDDSNGNWPSSSTFVKSVSNAFKATPHDLNRRPNVGEPNSTYEAPNGDTRTYGPDGKPVRDYDHDDHGYPNSHPHDGSGGHYHDWSEGKRGPAYTFEWETVAGVAVVTVCVIGIVVVALDDATVIGTADNVLYIPLVEGVKDGLIMVLG